MITDIQAALVKRALLDGISSVSGYVAYHHPRIQMWCAEATVPTERPRSVRIDMAVIDNPDTDWPRLVSELRAKSGVEFANPAGCVVSIEVGPAGAGGFWFRIGRPYSEDLRPRPRPLQAEAVPKAGRVRKRRRRMG
ncbi:MAG TPA: hypothetical protein VGP87_12315 [Gemmatimonadales bacterium]|nr:hypothetical protein [Gemmatimonadales bacterium]